MKGLEEVRRQLLKVWSGNDRLDKFWDLVLMQPLRSGALALLPCPPLLANSVRGNRRRIRQIFLNLVSNAVKYTPEGKISIHAAADDHNLDFWVSDTGIGISQEQQQHIFDGFTQAEASTTRRFGGTGLGLVICKRLVELMGGEL